MMANNTNLWKGLEKTTQKKKYIWQEDVLILIVFNVPSRVQFHQRSPDKKKQCVQSCTIWRQSSALTKKFNTAARIFHFTRSFRTQHSSREDVCLSLSLSLFLSFEHVHKIEQKWVIFFTLQLFHEYVLNNFEW